MYDGGTRIILRNRGMVFVSEKVAEIHTKMEALRKENILLQQMAADKDLSAKLDKLFKLLESKPDVVGRLTGQLTRKMIL